MEEHLTIITGASSGIGAALASEASQAGHTVATVSRRPGPGEHLACDLSDPASWPEMASWVGELVAQRAWGRITLIHNAGTLDPMGFAGEVDIEAYTKNVLLNSTSGQVLGSAFIEAVAGTGTTAMLMIISSGAGKTPYPGWSSYCAGKAATDMWVRVAGMEQAERGQPVSVLSMAPGVVATEMQANIRRQEASAFPNVERFREMHAGDELADPVNVAATIFGLAQQDTNGQTYRGATVSNGAVLDIRDLGS